jgi:hypothetical protein
MDGMTSASQRDGYQRPVRASGTPWWAAAAWVAAVSLAALLAVWRLTPVAPGTASVAQAARIALAGGGTPAAIASRLAASEPAVASATPAILAAVLIAALAATGGLFLGRGRSQPDTVRDARAAIAPVRPDPDLDAERQRLRACCQQRSVLARRVAELMPQMPESLAWQATNALNEAGIQVYEPDGEVFDPRVHHAVGNEPVVARGTENTVARTVRPGYRDGQQILVYPKVVVFADGPERGAR